MIMLLVMLLTFSLQAGSGDFLFLNPNMDIKEKRKIGIEKLTPEEIRKLDQFIKEIAFSAFKAGKEEGLKVCAKLLNSNGNGLESAVVIKDYNGERVIIQRENGEVWLLESKTYCPWTWKYEGASISLIFGFTSSKLINSEGDICEFWTEKQLK